METVNPNGEDTLLRDLRAINDQTDQNAVQRLREKVSWRNLNDPNNAEIFRIAREKFLY